MEILATDVFLNKKDSIKQVNHINNFSNLQYHIIFESGCSILIDKEILDKIKEKTNAFSKET